MMVNTFIRGLRMTDMKRHVYHQQPCDLTEAIQIAVAYEAFDRPLRESSRKPRITVAPVQGKSGKTVVESSTTDGDVTAELKSRRTKRDKSNVECYNCHQKGPYQRECPDKASGNAPSN